MDQNYVWDDSYAIACALKENHPDVELENVTLNMIYTWTIALEHFVDDPELANDEILTEILQEWLEEVDH
jgi:FeS assembly protein IscX